MKKLLFTVLLALSATAGAASFTADISYMGATMTGAYIKVTSASYTGSGWSCATSVWPSQLLSLTNQPTQVFSIPGQVASVSDVDTPLTMCMAVAKLVPYVSNVR